MAKRFGWRVRRRGLVGLGGLVGAATLLVATVLPGVAGPAAAAVTTDQSFTMPASGSFTFHGHGFGHGHGMSQYGAEGAARKGLTVRQIMAFYYPGTSLATTSSRIRVLITEDTTRDLEVVDQPGLSITDLGTGKAYPLPDIAKAVAWRLDVSGTKTVVAYKINAWHTYQLAPGMTALTGDGEFHATSGTMTLITPTGRSTYRGVLRAASPTPGSADRDTVNVVSLENYVRGVVPREMPTSWQRTAVRAQAVAARTYALFEQRENAGRYYQICDTSLCQVYGGYDAETVDGNDAVAAVAGRYLTYQGEPAFTQFSASNGGWTAAGSTPYLVAKADPYDGFSGNPVHNWTAPAQASVLQKKYPSLGTLKRIVITSRTGGGAWHGRVLAAKLVGSKKTIAVTGSDIAGAYGLRSTWFLPES